MYGSPNDGWENPDKFPLVEPTRATTAARFTVNSVTDGIIVPALKSVLLAVPAGLLSGLAAGAFHWQVNVWYLIPGTTLTVFIVVFWRSSSWWNNVLERMLGIDLNRDGTIGGQPAPQQPVIIEPEKVRVELITNKGQIGEAGDFIDLPYPEKIPVLAATVLEGRAFNQSAMVGTGKLFKRDEYDTLIDALIAAGLARWKNPEHHNIGWTLTGSGRAVLKRFYSPSPQDEDNQ